MLAGAERARQDQEAVLRHEVERGAGGAAPAADRLRGAVALGVQLQAGQAVELTHIPVVLVHARRLHRTMFAALDHGQQEAGWQAGCCALRPVMHAPDVDPCNEAHYLCIKWNGDWPQLWAFAII